VSFLTHSVAVSDVLVDGAQISAWRESNGDLNLSELFRSHAASADGSVPPAPPPAPAWAISVGTVTLRNATVAAEDRTVTPAAKLTLAPIGFTASGFSTAPGSKITIESSIGIDGNGQLAISGSARLDPLSADLKIELTKLDLAMLQPYLNAPTRVDLVSGLLSLSGHVAYAARPASGQPLLAAQGSVTVDDLATRDRRLQQDLIKWTRLALSGIDYQQGRKGLFVDTVRVRDLYGRVLIGPDSSLNVKHLLDPADAPDTGATGAVAAASQVTAPGPARAQTLAPKQVPAAPSIPVTVNTIQFENGSANFTDQSVQPTFATGMVGLNGSIKGLSSDPASRAAVDINGTVDRYAPVAITGALNVLSAALYTDLNVRFTNIDLTTFNPYSDTFVGYNISKGKLSTQFHYLIDNRQLHATHHIVIDQLEFGAATDSKKAVSLPVRFAAALLKDKDGVIDLTLPIDGSLDDPEFHIAPLLWQVLSNLLAKAVTAPFAALGHLFGGGEELSYVEFAPASSQIAPEQQQKLEKLVKGLSARPALKLDIPLEATDAVDSSAIAHATLDARLSTLPPLKPVTDPLAQAQQHAAALARLYQQALGAAPAYPPELAGKPAAAPDVAALAVRAAWLEAALLRQFTPDAETLAALGKARAEAVQALVLNNTGIAPQRVFLTERAPESPAPDGAVRLELKLQ
jgi:hypothetical protein